MVVGANRTVANNTTSISQNFYFFTHTDAALSMFNKFNISSLLPGTEPKFIPFLVSPRLTKLLLDFVPEGSNGTVINVLKSIDYQQKTVVDAPIK